MHPQIQIELDMSDRLRLLAQDGFDVAVRHTSAPPETHVAWTLAETRSVIVASRSYLHKRKAPDVPGALSEHACLHYPRTQGLPTWTFVPAVTKGRAKNATPITVEVAEPLAVNNSEALRDAAIEGLGIALLPDFSAQSALDAGRLVEVLPEWRPTGAFGERLYAIRPYAAHASRVSQVFIDYLSGAFSPGLCSQVVVARRANAQPRLATGRLARADRHLDAQQITLRTLTCRRA